MPEALPVLLLDQNVPMGVANWLRQARSGWTVHHVNELGYQGREDVFLFRWAQRHGAVVVTFDEDFADARTYPLGSHRGIVRLRIWPTTTEWTIAAMERLLDLLPPEQWAGRLIIVDNRKIRVRNPGMG
jgi:predicted nuclease of predicted toxin-antitoxin system